MAGINKPRMRLLLVASNVLVLASAATFLFESRPAPDAPPLPQASGLRLPGAAPCSPVYKQITTPFDAGARGTPLTTCRFVEQVRRAAYTAHLSTSSPPTELPVVSPATRKWYAMQCTPAVSYVTCTGGEDAIVYLYTTR